MHQNDIGYVLNASNTCPKPDFISDSHFLRVPVNDSFCEKILPWLDRSVEFIGQQSFFFLLVRRLAVLNIRPWLFQRRPRRPTPASWSTVWLESPARPPSPSLTS